MTVSIGVMPKKLEIIFRLGFACSKSSVFNLEPQANRQIVSICSTRYSCSLISMGFATEVVFNSPRIVYGHEIVGCRFQLFGLGKLL